MYWGTQELVVQPCRWKILSSSQYQLPQCPIKGDTGSRSRDNSTVVSRQWARVTTQIQKKNVYLPSGLLYHESSRHHNDKQTIVTAKVYGQLSPHFTISTNECTVLYCTVYIKKMFLPHNFPLPDCLREYLQGMKNFYGTRVLLNTISASVKIFQETQISQIIVKAEYKISFFPIKLRPN